MESLLKASHEGDINSLYLTIQKDPNILEKVDATPFIDTPLHIAASAGHLKYAMEIARLKPSFARKPNEQGSTPMHVALEKKQTEMVCWLLDFNAELVRVQGREGLTPLHCVVERGELNLLKMFLSSCNMSIMDLTIQKETVFHVALKNSKIQAFDLLFEKLQSIGLEDSARILNVQDLEGNSILHLAADENQDHVVNLLLRWDKSNPGKLQIGAVNRNGQTALEIATDHHHESIESLLMSSQQINSSKICSILKKGFHSALRIGLSGSMFESFYGKTASEKIRSNLLVVATLMAAATFQVVLNPPGGLNDDGHAKLYCLNHKEDCRAISSSPSPSPSPSPSTTTDSRDTVYYVVMYSNTFAFVVSITTILLLIGSFPMFWTFYAAAIAMLVTYYSSLHAIGGKILLTNWLFLVTPAFVWLMFFGGRVKRWLLSRRNQRALFSRCNQIALFSRCNQRANQRALFSGCRTKSKPKSESAPADENAV